jgi:hypothetical protein
MQFDPSTIMHASIANFMDSHEIYFLEQLLLMSQPAPLLLWASRPETAKLLDDVHRKAEALDRFTAKLLGITAALSIKGLNTEFVARPASDEAMLFERDIASAVQNCVRPAYKVKRALTESDIAEAYFAVLTTHHHGDKKRVIASALCNFRGYPDNEFATNMEAVHPKWQRKGVATLLFQFTEVVTEFMTAADPFVRLNLGRDTKSIIIRACVDHDAPKWHTEMMEKLGFDCDGRKGNDIEFAKEIQLY